MNQKRLYIFVHVPKTAGSTLRHHIAYNHRPDEVLWVYREIYFWNARTNEKKVLGTHDKIGHCLNSLSLEEKNKIKIILGHAAFYGIHKYFNKMPRYFTFIRDVADRTNSHYNFLLTDLNKGTLIEGAEQEILSPSGKVMPFADWLNTLSYMQNYVTKLLATRYWLSDSELVNEKSLEKLKRELNNFWFIGTPSRSDILYTYHVLGIKTFFEDQNVSVKYHVLMERDKALVRSKNNLDFELYEHCVQLNRRFKQDWKNLFYPIMAYMFIKKEVYFPIAAFILRSFNALSRYGLLGVLKRARTSYS